MLEEVEVPPEVAALDIEIPAKGPKLVQPPPRIRTVAQVYSVIPARALSDVRITNSHLRLLCALGVHVSVHGVIWPRLERIAAVGNRGRSWAYHKLRDLEAWGYVRRLQSFSKRKRRAITRQVMWEPDTPLPPRFTEEEKPDRTIRTEAWYFPRLTEEGDSPMAMTLEQRSMLTQNEIGAARAANIRLEQKLYAAAESIDRRVGDLRAKILGHAPAAAGHSTDRALSWLKMAARWPRAGSDDFLDAERVAQLEAWMKNELEPTIRAILAHVEVELRGMVGKPAKDSLRLQDLRPPSWAVKRGAE